MKTGRLRRICSLLAAISLCLAGCGTGTGASETTTDSSTETSSAGSTQYFDGGGKETLNIVSGSENKELSDILQSFADEENINLSMTYEGSLDIMRTLQGDTSSYDAVWPASSMWITAGDTNHKVKHIESISVTPVIFGIRQSLAEELGFVDTTVTVSDILDAVRAGKLSFCMTSATQSNSGCCAYIGFLYALLGNPDMITSEDLQNEDLQTELTELLSGVDRSSGSSDWLKDMFLSGDYDAMVNYECLIISANEELEKEGKETLYAVYPEDGLSLADSPLGYIDNGDTDKEDAFLKLQDYLLSDEVQNEIQATGRRTGYTLEVSDENRDVFNTDWGIQPDRVLSPFKMPSTDVLMEALDLYQSQLKKPSLTVYCLDYSGSMYGDGNTQLEKAMTSIFDQDQAAENLLQAGPDDVNIVIPFDSYARYVWTATGNGDDLQMLLNYILNEEPDGGTDMYDAATMALEELQNYDLTQYTTAIILMTDGCSMDYYDDFAKTYEESGLDVPVFSIMFGDADESQLDQLATLTNARVFDGREDLVSAFRAVRGYN